jgi:hypothetical protein
VQEAGQPSVNTHFLVIRGSTTPLLGKTTALESVRIGVICSDSSDHSILKKYPGLGKGKGKLKNFEVGRHIDPSVNTPTNLRHQGDVGRDIYVSWWTPYWICPPLRGTFALVMLIYVYLSRNTTVRQRHKVVTFLFHINIKIGSC